MAIRREPDDYNCGSTESTATTYPATAQVGQVGKSCSIHAHCIPEQCGPPRWSQVGFQESDTHGDFHIHQSSGVRYQLLCLSEPTSGTAAADQFRPGKHRPAVEYHRKKYLQFDADRQYRGYPDHPGDGGTKPQSAGGPDFSSPWHHSE